MMCCRSVFGAPFNTRSRFFRTVIQGNTDPRWVIRIPRRLGARIGRPSIKTSPRSGASNPASTFRSVDFPQPDGPTMETNSPSRTVNDMSSTADTRPSPALKLLHIALTAILAPTDEPPADFLQGLQPSHDDVQQQADRADDDHPRDHEVIPHARIARIDDEIAESRVDPDHLRGDHDEPPYAQRHSHAGDDRRKGARDDDRAEQLEPGDPEVLRRANVLAPHHRHARRRADNEGKERCQKDEKRRPEIAHTEPQDGQRDPGDRGDRAQHLDRGVERREGRRGPAHQDSQRNRQQNRQAVSEGDAVERRRHMPNQHAVLRQFRHAPQHLRRRGEDDASAGGEPPDGSQAHEHADGEQPGHGAVGFMSTGRAFFMNLSSTYLLYSIGLWMIFASRQSRINSSNSDRINRRSPYVTRSGGRSMTHLINSNAWLNIDGCDAIRAAVVRCSGLVSSHRPAANTWSTRSCTVSGCRSISSCRTVSMQQM